MSRREIEIEREGGDRRERGRTGRANSSPARKGTSPEKAFFPCFSDNSAVKVMTTCT